MHLISFLYQERTESFSHNCSEKILGKKNQFFTTSGEDLHGVCRSAEEERRPEPQSRETFADGEPATSPVGYSPGWVITFRIWKTCQRPDLSCENLSDVYSWSLEIVFIQTNCHACTYREHPAVTFQFPLKTRAQKCHSEGVSVVSHRDPCSLQRRDSCWPGDSVPEGFFFPKQK